MAAKENLEKSFERKLTFILRKKVTTSILADLYNFDADKIDKELKQFHCDDGSIDSQYRAYGCDLIKDFYHDCLPEDLKNLKKDLFVFLTLDLLFDLNNEHKQCHCLYLMKTLDNYDNVIKTYHLLTSNRLHIHTARKYQIARLFTELENKIATFKSDPNYVNCSILSELMHNSLDENKISEIKNNCFSEMDDFSENRILEIKNNYFDEILKVITLEPN